MQDSDQEALQSISTVQLFCDYVCLQIQCFVLKFFFRILGYLLKFNERTNN